MKFLFVATLHHPGPGPLPRRFVHGEGDPLFPSSQGHHFWVRALRRLGHRCAVFWRATGAGGFFGRSALQMSESITAGRALNRLATVFPHANPIIRRRNAELIAAASSYQPDIIIVVGDNDVVLPGTLARLRQRGARVVYASGTSPIVFSRPIERESAPLYDLVVVNDRYHGIQWLELGAKRADVLPLSAVDPEFHRPRLKPPASRRVVFVGTLVPERLYSERIDALLALADQELDIWSVHDVPTSLRRFHRGAALGPDMLTVLQNAAIAVNPHGNFMRYGGNMRLFEICGVGTLQIADDRPCVHEWFDRGRHLLTYRTPDELRSLTRQYLDDVDERERIARAGCEHVHAQHTYRHRMERLVALIETLPRR